MTILDGKVALVTGAAHGIGRGHALELARQGAKVIVNDLGGTVTGEGASRDADTVVDLIKSRGGEAIADYGDVGNEAQVDAMIAKAVETWGRFDIVVNNAGIVRDRSIWNMTVEDFDQVVNVHLRGTWLTCRAAARHWRAAAKANGSVYGRIINTTSGAGLVGNFGQSNYATAKAGVVGLTLTLCVELANIGVTANLISPGAITRLSATMPGMPEPKEADELDADEWNPLGPAVSSPVVAWLASPDAGFVTGQCFRVIRDKIHWMQGWSELKAVSNGNKPWDATKLTALLQTDIFGTRAPGLRMGG